MVWMPTVIICVIVALKFEGVKFYGVPMFMNDCVYGKQQKNYDKIPDDTDVLITHTPPFGILDFDDNINYGAEELLPIWSP